MQKVRTRSIKPKVQCLLWGKAAGRCEFAGCNRPLWKSSVTQESVNLGEKAHIYAFSARGPRGNSGQSKDQLNELENLLLVCHECHLKIDREGDSGRYGVELVRRMKAEHEQRTERVCGVAPARKSHVLLFGANIGAHSSPLAYHEAARALFPDRYPASDRALELTTVNSPRQDRDEDYWKVESENLRRNFSLRVRERIVNGEVEHLSVFALAPQPLLILLGSLLIDIVPADVYQRHREPHTWEWPAGESATGFQVFEPENRSGVPALVIALSATITTDRIQSVLGTNVSIWATTTSTPHNDLIKSKSQLSELRGLLRRMLDRIKAVHGQTTPLHIFPAAAVSVAVELGRIRMPKADAPWRVYDQVNARGGFVHALSTPNGDGT